MTRFEKLEGYPDQIRGRFNSFITTQFDDSLSVEMQIRSLIKWINSSRDLVNDMSDYMNLFIETFDERLQQEIVETLNDWLVDGTLTEIINENVFGMKADKTFVESEIERLEQTYGNLNTQLDKKADKTVVDSAVEQLDEKADKTVVDSAIERLEQKDEDLATQLTKTERKIDDSSPINAIDLVHTWQTQKTQTTTPVYIEVGDSLRASHGAHTYEQIHDYLTGYGVITHLVATSGLKAEHFSKATPNLQSGFHTFDSVLNLITNDGFNTVVNISLGMNDVSKSEVEIESYLQKIVNEILVVKPQTKFIFTSPQKTENDYTYEKLNKAYRNIVSKNAVSFIDVGSNVFTHFTQAVKSLYFLDSTHPNEQGQLKIGQYIVSQLRAENARQPYSTITPNIPQDYYVRVARFVLQQQWMGVTGRLKIVQLGSAYYEANTTHIDLFTYLRNPLPSLDTTNVIYDFSNVNSEQPDILTSNIFVRPTIMNNKMTIVDVFIKNRVSSNRKYKVSFEGHITGGIGTGSVIINSTAPIQHLPNPVSGGTDATVKTKDNIVLSSPNGFRWKIGVDDEGNVSTTNVQW